MPLTIKAAQGRFEREQAQDLRRSVLCGELHLHRDLVDDGRDEESWLGIAWSGPKPVGTVRLRRDGEHTLLELLAVLPLQRRQGVGRSLVHAAIAQVSAGTPALTALSPDGSAPFFQALGFQAERQIPGLTVWQKTLG